MSKFFPNRHADKKKKNPLPKVITLGRGSYGLKSPYTAFKGLLCASAVFLSRWVKPLKNWSEEPCEGCHSESLKVSLAR